MLLSENENVFHEHKFLCGVTGFINPMESEIKLTEAECFDFKSEKILELICFACFEIYSKIL